MSWTTFEDVTDRWVGQNEPTDEALVDALILDAESVILSVYPAIQTRIDADTISINVVKMVVVRMVSRVLRNPENLTYWQQQTGPFGQARNFGTNGSDIWLTEDEKNMLAPSNRGKAFSVDLAPDAGINLVRQYSSLLTDDAGDFLYSESSIGE
jgi:hypothetical protein